MVALSLLVCGATFVVADVNKRVINGTDSAKDYPWMASVGTTGPDAARGHFCGAVIVDQQYALTAAHCLEGLSSTPESIQVFIGKSNLADKSAKIVSVEGMIIHPEFNPDTQQSDIALLRLSEILDSRFVIPLLTKEEEATIPSLTKALLLGWGTTDPKLTVRPSVLQEALIPLTDSQTCQSRIGLDFDSNTMICGGTLSSTSQNSDGVDACYGDSGGPLVVQTASGFKLLGLASWGLSCASEKYWGVYTRVPSFANWVKNSRTVAPYLISAPLIDGVPKAGSKIVCDGGIFGGDVATAKSVLIQDAESGQVLTKGGVYSLKKSDVGRSVTCVVSIANQGGELLSQSDVVGPIFPGGTSRQISFPKASPISSARISCPNGKCTMLLSFKKAQSGIRALLQGGKSRGTTNWKKATKLTAQAWTVALPGNWKSLTGLMIRSLGADKKSYLSEGRF